MTDLMLRSKRPKLPGTLIASRDSLHIAGYHRLPFKAQQAVLSALADSDYTSTSQHDPADLRISFDPSIRVTLLARVGQALHNVDVLANNRDQKRFDAAARRIRTYSEPIDFPQVLTQAHALAQQLREKTDQIATALEDYETYNVVLDEIERSVDLLTNLSENREYFQHKINGVTSFLPLNQPLYSTICFGVVPAYMARDIAIRPPTNVHAAYSRLHSIAEFDRHVPNLHIAYTTKEQFVHERASVTDVVIFTGTPQNGEMIRRQMLPPLFILNGAGHNPIVVTESADIDQAVASTLRLTLQNQGQDCAAPNAILVQVGVLHEFEARLIANLRALEAFVGHWKDRRNIVGPNTDSDHVLRIASVFLENRSFCLHGGMLNPTTSLIYPTVFRRSLSRGPNLTEFFAPVIMIHPYTSDTDLRLYFEHPQYYSNAMYVTVFGFSSYVETLIEKGLHTRENILYNTDLHHEERGFLPYGGLGPAASCVYSRGQRIPGATLPQRDIYQYLVRPALTPEKETYEQINIAPHSVVIGG